MKSFFKRKSLKNFGKNFLHHKHGLGALTIASISIFLVLQTMFCLFYPSEYPTQNLADIVTYRSVVNEVTNDYRLFSSVGFTEAPINSKQRFEVVLDSLNEIEVNWNLGMYLNEKNVVVNYDVYKFLNYTVVNNLDVSYNGIPSDYGVIEEDGMKYYTLSNVKVTDEGEVTQIEINFEIERNVIASKLTKTPILFNENYARIIHIPMTTVPVQLGSESDSNLLKVNLEVPFQRILKENSGWIDSFVPPEDEWEKYLVEQNNYRFPVFEYPIEQEYQQEKNVYTFNAFFSENNIAHTMTLILIPDYSVLAILGLFLALPLFCPILMIANELKWKNKSTFKKYLLVTFEVYGLLTFSSVITVFFGGELNLSFFIYILEIINPFFLFFVVCSPAFFCLFYTYWKARNQNTNSV